MIQSRFKTCFILAPLGADTSILRQALAENHIQWFDHTILKPGSNWIDGVDRAITKADFVCAVLPESQHGNVLIELGIACARHKPILAFVESTTNLPSDIMSLTYFRTDLRDGEIVRSGLGIFLRHVSGKPVYKALKSRIPVGTRRRQTSFVPFHSSEEFQRKTAELLQSSGFILSWPTEKREQGADLAVWIDELQHLGNPLLVEVKAGDLSPVSLSQAASQLRSHVAKANGRYGLLVYWDRQNREFPTVTTEWPLIFQLSGKALTKLVQQKRLPKELVRLRNAAVHGEV